MYYHITFYTYLAYKLYEYSSLLEYSYYGAKSTVNVLNKIIQKVKPKKKQEEKVDPYVGWVLVYDEK